MSRFVASAVALLIGVALIAGCATGSKQASAPAPVVFVCEHGNVKSLMAMSYFNQLAQRRGLPLVAISRGTAPDSDTVPTSILEGLRADGVDASGFRPAKVAAPDLRSARRIVTFGVSLPAELPATDATAERWDDVPPASVDFEASSRAIKSRVQALLDELAGPRD